MARRGKWMNGGHIFRHGPFGMFKHHYICIPTGKVSDDQMQICVPKDTLFTKYYAILVTGRGKTVANKTILRE